MTACPLDCYDACQIIYEDGALKGGDEAVTAKHLCPHMNHYELSSQLQTPLFEGREISLEDAKSQLVNLLKETDPSKVLFYRGSGNLGKLQSLSDLFFAQYGAALTQGSLCDAAGHQGIIQGRGYNEVMDPSQIEKSDVVVLWGRNPANTHSHILRFLKGKKIIVIDPIKTDLAKKADLHIQIKPRGDFYLAVLLARFALMEEIEDKAYIETFAENFTWFRDFLHSIRIKVAMEKSGIIPSEIYGILNLIKGQKVAFLVGASVQKYVIGSSVLRAIDSLAVLLGLMGKEGCGVSFLGDTSLGVESPFATAATHREPKATADFSQYDLIIFQGSNAVESMPDSSRVRRLLEGKKVVYFGLDDNATSQRADLVIPAKSFLAKEDIRFSYADHTAKVMESQIDRSSGISEYELADHLCRAFDLAPLKDEQSYIQSFLAGCELQKDNVYRVKERAPIAYEKGFATEEDAFVFIEEYHDSFVADALFLITPKSDKALNTMFKRPEHVYLHPSFGFESGAMVKIESSYGEVILPLAVDERQRADTVCIYVGTAGLNHLTPSLLDETQTNAVYQEISVRVSVC